MLNIVSTWIFWTLHANEVLILSLLAFHNEPVNGPIALVLVSLDMVPPQDKVLRDIVDTVSDQGKRYIVPWHAPKLTLAELVLLPVVDGLKVHDPIVVEVLAGEDFVLDADRVNVCQGVLVAIPAPKAGVEASDECKLVVNDDEFLVMSLFDIRHCHMTRLGRLSHPVKRHIAHVFENIVIRMAQDLDVSITRRAFWT